ncbi:centrosomal protein of 19 kDa isoform X2 [Xiphias gladius]|uniref:centrosomal protein of 19 kDa isoform X2 n=1 Tax=Xiphias gladius TaxID=8245 RepID=UPI001A985C48|nr:centrosomal protein of 19 kDa isoform X2 [Xiphias gladius]
MWSAVLPTFHSFNLSTHGNQKSAKKNNTYYSMAAELLKNHPRHRDYLQGVSQSQLEKLHIILRDHMQGFSLEHSLASFHLDPNEDLNKLDDEELARKKGQMDELFEKNCRRKDDPNFVYDLEVDFSKPAQEKCSWDDESDDGF